MSPQPLQGQGWGVFGVGGRGGRIWHNETPRVGQEGVRSRCVPPQRIPPRHNPPVAGISVTKDPQALSPTRRIALGEATKRKRPFVTPPLCPPRAVQALQCPPGSQGVHAGLPPGRGQGCKLQGAGHVNTDQGMEGPCLGAPGPPPPQGTKNGGQGGVHKPQPSPCSQGSSSTPWEGALELGTVTLDCI